MNRCLDLLICPICEGRLASDEHSFRCPQNHTFDIAREGYVNLLPTAGKRPKFLGDSKEMLQARRSFLEQGYYIALVEAVQTQLWPYIARFSGRSPVHIAEAGCGEGYYLGRLKEALDAQPEGQNCCYLGVDISKEAVRLAARRYKEISFVVADVKRKLPLVGSSVQLLLDIFAPRNGSEFARLLDPAGVLLVVIPGPDHLANLPSTLKPLGMETHKRQRLVEQMAPFFRLAGEQRLSYDVALDGESLGQLIQMTPNYRHLSPAQVSKLKSVPEMQVRLSFVMLLFEDLQGL
jgi:SAM-dependent methyltransferase